MYFFANNINHYNYIVIYRSKCLPVTFFFRDLVHKMIFLHSAHPLTISMVSKYTITFFLSFQNVM